jgi:ABC-type uncharacterized transport system permease subunit
MVLYQVQLTVLMMYVYMCGKMLVLCEFLFAYVMGLYYVSFPERACTRSAPKQNINRKLCTVSVTYSCVGLMYIFPCRLMLLDNHTKKRGIQMLRMSINRLRTSLSTSM